MAPKRTLVSRLLCGLLALLAALVLGQGLGLGGGHVAQASPIQASSHQATGTPATEAPDTQLEVGNIQLGTVRILGIPVITVASPVISAGGQVLNAQQRARVIEGNLARLYAPQQLCSSGEALAESFLELGFLHGRERACNSEAMDMAGTQGKIEIRVRGADPGPIELVANVKGRQKPWPLLTVTEADALWNGTSQLQLAQRWQRVIERRLGYARSLLEPQQLLSRMQRVVGFEVVLVLLLATCLGLWRRCRRSLRKLDRTPPAVIAKNPRLLRVLEHAIQNLSRGLLLLAAVLVVLSIGIAEIAVPGQLPVALDLLLKPGGLLLKLLALWLVTALARVVLASLLKQWAENIDVPSDRRARRNQRHISLQRVLGRLVDLGSMLMGVTWILGDIPGVKQLSAAAVVAGGALLGALAIVFQGLLRDFVAGLVVIFDDRYAIGDNVEIHGLSGTVTDVGLLSTELRCADQRVVVIQNSGFEQVVNHTKLRSGIDVRLPLSPGNASLEPVLEVIRQVNKSFAEDPEWSARLLETPLLRGVDDITPQAIVVSVLLTTQAGEQWAAKRALMQRLVIGLEEAGIPLANIERPVLTGA